MHKILFWGLVISALLLSSQPVFAQEVREEPAETSAAMQEYNLWRQENVSDWNLYWQDSVIEVAPNREMTVTEIVIADFTNSPHHGLLRWIPIRYKTDLGISVNLPFELLEITDENGNPWQYKLDTWGSYSSFGKNAYLKIGDPNVTYDTVKTYVIKYKVKNAVTFFPDHDELYWNALGVEGTVPVYGVTAEIILQQEAEDLKAVCYTGYLGSREQDCTAEIKDKKTFSFSATRAMGTYEGMTIAASFPKGIVTEPTSFEKFSRFIRDNWPFVLPIIAFIIMFYLWYTRGRDFAKVTVMPQYTPPKGMTPLQAGTLIDEEAHNEDISASIIDLAVRGFIKIEEIADTDNSEKVTDYKFIRLKSSEEGLQEHEKKLINGIFGTKQEKLLSDLQYKFAEHLASIRDHIYEDLTQKGFFVKNPKKVVEKYISIAVIMVVVMVPLLIIFFAFLGTAGIIGTALSVITVVVFGFYMPRKTLEGSKALAHLKGLREYIDTAEKDRIKFEEKTGKRAAFEKLLPYALAFGVAEKWAKAFEGIYTSPPDWYAGRSWGSHFYPVLFIYSLSNATNSMQETFTSIKPSSRSSAWGGGSGFSGGFSGGGFGGGGHGGW